MVKRSEAPIPKDRVSIVISREDRKHLGFIALERDLSSSSDALSYVLSYFDRTGRLKRQKEPEPLTIGAAESGGLAIL